MLQKLNAVARIPPSDSERGAKNAKDFCACSNPATEHKHAAEIKRRGPDLNREIPFGKQARHLWFPGLRSNARSAQYQVVPPRHVLNEGFRHFKATGFVRDFAAARRIAP